jgi:hypothetical protein
MKKLIDEFRRGWQGVSQPSLLFSTGFAIGCLALATLARWGLAQIRPDVFFTPYLPAVFFATAFGGLRMGVLTAIASGALGVTVNFGDATADPARIALLLIYWVVCGLTIWGVVHYRSIVAQQRRISKRLIQEEEYRKLLVDELQHRLKNKSSTIHAVLHQVLLDQPQIWSAIDHRIRALSATDDLIARVDGSGCDIRDLLLSELGPYGHVRFTLNGNPLFLPAKLAVSLALIFHELATNAGKYGAFRRARAVAGVLVGVRRSPLRDLGRDRRSCGRPCRGCRLRDQIIEVGAAFLRRQDRDRLLEDRRPLHHAMPPAAD